MVRFTPLGQKISDKALRILRESEELADLARAEGQPLTGELRMGVIPTIAPFLLPAMLPRLRREWPSLKLFLREETSQSACDALHRGQLDCVLLAMPYACGEVDIAVLFDDPLFVALRRARRPAKARSSPARSTKAGCCCSRTAIASGSCSVGMQPAGAAPKATADGHFAAHVGADGRQRPRPDLRAGDGNRRHPRRNGDRRAATAFALQLPAHRASPGKSARARRSSNCSRDPARSPAR